jgi:hypothetical protein
VGGAFKAFSLIKALRYLGMKVVLVGSQTGNDSDYATLQEMCDDGTIILDDANPLELSKYIIEKKADLFIGGVKERPIAFKMGIGFCDHNHERKIPLAGFAGMLQFAREVHTSVTSPVWQFVPARKVHVNCHLRQKEPSNEIRSSNRKLHGHPECLQPVCAAGRGAGIQGHCQHRPPAAWLPGLLHLYPPVHDQPLQGAAGHCLLQFRRGNGHLRRWGQHQAGHRQHPQANTILI